jgi:hypothetical protein
VISPEVVCPTGEALRIAVDQARFKISEVAFIDGSAAQCAVLVGTRHAVIDENESRCMRKCASGERQIGAQSGPQSVRNRCAIDDLNYAAISCH